MKGAIDISFIAGYLLGLSGGGGSVQYLDRRVEKLKAKPCLMRIDIADGWNVQVKIDDADDFADPVEVTSFVNDHGNGNSYSVESLWPAYMCVYHGDEFLYALARYQILGREECYTSTGGFHMYQLRECFVDSMTVQTITQSSPRDFPIITIECRTTHRFTSYDENGQVTNVNTATYADYIGTKGLCGAAERATGGISVHEALITALDSGEFIRNVLLFRDACGLYYNMNNSQ